MDKREILENYIRLAAESSEEAKKFVLELPSEEQVWLDNTLKKAFDMQTVYYDLKTIEEKKHTF